MEPTSFSYSSTGSRHKRESSSLSVSDFSDSTAVTELSDTKPPLTMVCPSLPPELWAGVFLLLDTKDIPNVVTTCREFYQIVETHDLLNKIGLSKIGIQSYHPFHSYRRFHQHYKNLVWMGSGIWWGNRDVFGSLLRTFFDVQAEGFALQFIIATEDGESDGIDHDEDPAVIPFNPALRLATVSTICTPDLDYDQCAELHPSALGEQISYAVQRCVNIIEDAESDLDLWPPKGHSEERTTPSFSGTVCFSDMSQNLFRLRKRLCPFRTPVNEVVGLTETFSRLETWHGRLGGIFVAPGMAGDGPVFLNIQHKLSGLTATHITGGTRVPRGEIAFATKFSPADHDVEKFWGSKGYHGWAQLARHNYVHPEYVSVVVIIEDENTLALWWLKFRIVTMVKRVDLDSIAKGTPMLSEQTKPIEKSWTDRIG